MGLLQSVFCNLTFCFERVLTWACCAGALILLMFGVLVFIAYGIAAGYQYAQKELATFGMGPGRAAGLLDGSPDVRRRAGSDVVRLTAVNRTEPALPPQVLLDALRRQRASEEVYLPASVTPLVVLETDRTGPPPQLSEDEKALARSLLQRMRRSTGRAPPPPGAPPPPPGAPPPPAAPFLRPLGARARVTVALLA